MLYVHFKKIKMDSFEINKIFAAIIVTVLLVLGINKVSDVIFHVEKPNVEGYKVEVKVVSTSQTNEQSQVDISALLALGSVENGKKVFKKCAACHSINEGGGNKIGPKLWNVMLRPVGSIADYKYSKALSTYGKEWTWEEMNGFLIKPAKWIKGNKMGFAGLKKEEDRASILLYLKQNSDNPKTLP